MPDTSSGARQTPVLILFAGPACAWKTTIAAQLAARLRVAHLQMDEARVRLLPNSAHTRADRAIAYRAMHMAAELLLSHGASVILDAPYGRSEDRQDASQAAVRGGGKLLLVECKVSPEAAVRRFAVRGPDNVRLDLTPERVEQMAREYPYTAEGLLLDTDAWDPASCVSRVEQYVCGQS